ncbi:MAG: phosphoribosylaminoimidazolesuccinocarboxamide synthase, partial [Candidatus Bathyarchaeia archaeon]
ILTPTTKSEVGHDVETSKEEAIDKEVLTEEEWKTLEEASLKLYEFYHAHAKRRGVILADVKFEFGRWRGELIQIDEAPTHDSARLWDATKYAVGRRQESYCLDKEFLREYLRRVGFMGEGEPPSLPWSVVVEVSKRCVGAYKVLTGGGEISDFKFKTLDELMMEMA